MSSKFNYIIFLLVLFGIAEKSFCMDIGLSEGDVSEAIVLSQAEQKSGQGNGIAHNEGSAITEQTTDEDEFQDEQPENLGTVINTVINVDTPVSSLNGKKEKSRAKTSAQPDSALEANASVTNKTARTVTWAEMRQQAAQKSKKSKSKKNGARAKSKQQSTQLPSTIVEYDVIQQLQIVGDQTTPSYSSMPEPKNEAGIEEEIDNKEDKKRNSVIINKIDGAQAQDNASAESLPQAQNRQEGSKHNNQKLRLSGSEREEHKKELLEAREKIKQEEAEKKRKAEEEQKEKENALKEAQRVEEERLKKEEIERKHKSEEERIAKEKAEAEAEESARKIEIELLQKQKEEQELKQKEEREERARAAEMRKEEDEARAKEVATNKRLQQERTERLRAEVSALLRKVNDSKQKDVFADADLGGSFFAVINEDEELNDLSEDELRERKCELIAKLNEINKELKEKGEASSSSNNESLKNENHQEKDESNRNDGQSGKSPQGKTVKPKNNEEKKAQSSFGVKVKTALGIVMVTSAAAYFIKKYCPKKIAKLFGKNEDNTEDEQ